MARTGKCVNFLPVTPDGRVIVRFGKKRLGWLGKQGKKWHYYPYGCEGKIKSEGFKTLAEIKAWIRDPDAVWPGPKPEID
ncbi:hypothetical protein X831_gp088 [Pseudomonas phage PAK_P2]|uniref:Uncharacterized protein n=2 Tax=Pakpunavirus TaxID=1921407 RepID=V5JVH8_9CAUD|nr:hypothetical protein X831_gp088 [Pseudomonas phage PAK_P2]YP_010765586.1 hypothetical protein QE349_gp093 [Pseudomonas phage vB_Paer_PsCh]AGR89208.1 hypothetical protein PAK_P200087 [Pseudomonas phage PAK_P2]UOL47924.1 hypothetical protein vBPaerPsCh_93 [Pseudomonas phage vB_Paer_PsCh]